MRYKTNEADAVTLRFLQIIDWLREEHHISISHIERQLGIAPTIIHRQRKNPERSLIRPFWLEALCREYHVRPTWLLLGVGHRFYVTSNPTLYLDRSKMLATSEQTEFTAE